MREKPALSWMHQEGSPDRELFAPPAAMGSAPANWRKTGPIVSLHGTGEPCFL